uniref:Uncharacterized protein n=1 Tax=Salmo trutta TaxID=8032 RepID=A0A673VV55_SALTR
RVCACVTTFSFLLDLKEKKLVEEAENGKDTPANGKAVEGRAGKRAAEDDDDDDDEVMQQLESIYCIYM